MSRARDVEAAQQANARLAAEIGDEPWCTGIGLAPGSDGGLVLRVDVDPELLADAKVPRRFEGFAVEVVEVVDVVEGVEIGSYRPRRDGERERGP